jgi:phage FluMu gp28-like protein
MSISPNNDEGGTGRKANAQSPNAGPDPSPRDLLLPYQRAWADDNARWKIGLMSRQVGKDFSSGEEGIRDCVQHELDNNKVDWLIGAPSERQALESLNKWKDWAEAYKLAIADVLEERETKSAEALLKSGTIIFPHGSRVIAVPGKPDTVRGFSANILLTEFAFFENPDATWRAILPSITNPLRGGVKRVRLISTPNGIGNKFHDLWSQNVDKPNAKWSCHFVDIYRAVKEGLPVDIEELKAALNDPDGWAQEFECQFLDAASVLLPYELIALCESAEAHLAAPAEFWESTTPFPVDLGIDYGRKKNLTVSWACEMVGDVQATREVFELQNMSTPDQIDILRPRIQKARRVSLDYTGPGIGMGDYMVKEFGEWKPEQDKFGKIELCTMTNSFKLDIFPKLKMAFESRKVRIPISRLVREDLHSMQRVVTAHGNVTYRAPQSEDGHADRTNGLALCVHAGSAPAAAGRIIVPEDTRHSRVIADRRERSLAG